MARSPSISTASNITRRWSIAALVFLLAGFSASPVAASPAEMASASKIIL
jgi:hypothetical protein